MLLNRVHLGISAKINSQRLHRSFRRAWHTLPLEWTRWTGTMW